MVHALGIARRNVGAAVGLLLLALLAACSGPKILVRSDEVRAVQDLFVLAGSPQDFQDVADSDPKSIMRLVTQTGRLDSYKTAVQFTPASDPARWTARRDIRTDSAVEVKSKDDSDEIEIKVDADLAEADAVTVCVVLHAESIWVARRLSGKEIASSKTIRLRVRGLSIETDGD